MQYINITPRSILSCLLACSILFNTSLPTVAQVVQSSSRPNNILPEKLERQISQTLPTDAIFSKQVSQIAQFRADEIRLSNGSLTSAQLSRLGAINFMFRTPLGAKETKSDFDIFKESYTTQVNEHFNHEKNSLQATKKELSDKVAKNIKDWRKEVYKPLVDEVTTEIAKQITTPDKKTLSNLSKTITQDILSLSIDPDKSLADQISSLNKKYTHNPQAIQIINQVAQKAQSDRDQKYLLREQAIKVWQKEAMESVEEWYSKNTASLQQWKKESDAKAKTIFEKEYSPKMLQAREEEVTKAVKDLWAYKDLAPKSYQTLLKLTPIIAQLRTLEGKSFFTPQQTQWIISQYLQILKKSTDNTQTSTSDNCELELAALSGLGMLSNSRETANAIESFMIANRQTSCAVPSLLTGTVALLSMKQYQVLEGFLYAATRDEHNIKDVDLLSIENLVNVLANTNGQYLGEVSKYAQYPLQENPTQETASGNAWEDVAQLLADEGSPQSLNLLRKYGVEKCFITQSTTTSLKTKTEMNCAGIIPFLVGALASGKSGADQYKPISAETRAGYVASNHGSTYITPKDAQQNATKLNNQVQAFYQYAANMGMNNTAAIARHLFLQSMGDLNAESELLVDTTLFKVYQKALANKAPKAEFAISSYTRNSPTYNAKRMRQDRTRFFRKAGFFADIGILVWCVADITKWSASGIKIARSMMKASAMARNGATVAQRAVMLRNLNIAPKLRSFVSLSGKVKGRVAPAILAELPLFSSQTVELPRFPGFVEASGKIAADALRFSAETGTLGVDVAAMQNAAAGTLTSERVSAFNNMLGQAATNANTQFASRSRWKRFWTWDKNSSYRSHLTSELMKVGENAGFTLEELNPINFRLATSNIAVPENISSFRLPSLLDKTNGMPTLNVAALRQLMTISLGTAPTEQQLAHTQSLFNTALTDTNLEFLSRNWFARQWNFLRYNAANQYRNMLVGNLTAQADREAKIFSDPTSRALFNQVITAIKNDPEFSAPAFLTQLSQWGGRAKPNKFQAMGTTLLATGDQTQAPQVLPLLFSMQRKIKGVGKSAYQRVLITEKNGKLLFGFGNDLKEPLTPSQFKLTLEPSDIPSLIRSAAQSTLDPAKPLEIKLTAPGKGGIFSSSFYTNRLMAFKQADGFWNSLGTLLRGKNNIYVHDVTVAIRQADGSLQSLPLVFKADSYLGLRNASAVLEADGSLAWYRGNQLLREPRLTFGLPKNQIRPFLDVLGSSGLQQPLHITAISGKNKIQPLMWATGLSLSSASTGLIAPLENVYGNNITEGEKSLISLAFPYLPSLAAPLFSPLVMKIGALRTLQIALGFSTLGLFVAATNGFKGKLDPKNLPPIWPLYVSGVSIGVSSALSRSGLNLLIDSMGGGGTLLKSMAYKNIGSFALLLPPFLANYYDKDIDFSFAFPVLGTISALALTWVSTSRLSTQIGKEAGFMKFVPLDTKNLYTLFASMGKNIRTAWTETKKETASTTRLLLTKEVLPLVVAATAFTGFEAGAFSKAGNQMIRPNLQEQELPAWVPESNRNNFVQMLTNLSVIAFPLAARFTAKPTLKLFEAKNPGDEYRRMLQASFALNTAGVSLLYANGFNGYGSLGMLGIGLMGFGTANMTQSFQKLSNISVKSSSYARSLIKGLSASEKETLEKSLVTKTMTGFPVQQLGIAIVPTIVSSYTDRQIDEGIIKKVDAAQSSMWIPVLSLALCFGASASRIGLFPSRIQTGTVGLTKGIFGSYPGASQQLFGRPVVTEPDFGKPTSFTPIPTQPIVNMGETIPSHKTLKNIETELEGKVTSNK